MFIQFINNCYRRFSQLIAESCITDDAINEEPDLLNLIPSLSPKSPINSSSTNGAISSQIINKQLLAAKPRQPNFTGGTSIPIAIPGFNKNSSTDKTHVPKGLSDSLREATDRVKKKPGIQRSQSAPAIMDRPPRSIFQFLKEINMSPPTDTPLDTHGAVIYPDEIFKLDATPRKFSDGHTDYVFRTMTM